MSREIKFRCWWPGVKQMKFFVPGNFEDTPNGWAMTFIQPEGNGNIYLGTAEIMQYTGLKDKNGKEIYEGDIMDFGSNRVFYVSYVGCQFVATFSERVINTMIPIYNFEIVGNIYENPELIEAPAQV